MDDTGVLPTRRKVFVTGGTGYIGRRLLAALLERGHEVCALVRAGSERKLPAGCPSVAGNPFDRNSFASSLNGFDTFVQLVGVAHPSPSKAHEFRTIDFVSAHESIAAATHARIPHFIYLSVAHPAPAMHAYVEVRKECEELLRSSGLNATIVRPWYVLGPGHRWPYLLLPIYWLASVVPSMSEAAKQLGLVTLNQMIVFLVGAVEDPSTGVRVLGVPEIRAGRRS